MVIKVKRKNEESTSCLQALEATRLMGSLCYASRLEASPYRDLVAQAQWDAASREFVRQCCGLMGLVSSYLLQNLQARYCGYTID